MKVLAILVSTAALAGCASGIKASTATAPPVNVADTKPAADSPPATDPPTTKPKVTTPPTTAAPTLGTRTNPFSSSFSWQGFDPFFLLSIDAADPALVQKANQFNDEPLAGQIYVKLSVSGTYTGTGSGSSSDIRFNLKIAGDKSKVYEAASVSDSRNVLSLLSDQPDVIQGGSMAGYIYYLVDADDANFLAVVDGTDGPQFAKIGAP